MNIDEKPPIVPRQLHGRRYVIALVVSLSIVAALIIVDLQPYFSYLAKKRHIQSLISIGSNIDDAPAILKSQGFQVGEKYLPTVDKDYYWIDIQVATKPRPVTLTILSLVGVRAYFHWLTLEAGLDNRIRAIL